MFTLDTAVHRVTQAFALALIALYAFFVCELAWESLPAIFANGWFLLTGTRWNATKGVFGLWPLIYGTLITTAIAMAIGVPVGREIAIASVLYKPSRRVERFIKAQSIQRLIGVVLGTLIGMPSVIVGMWGLLYIFPLMPTGYGSSLLTAGLVLAVIVTPLIAFAYRAAFLAVPDMRGQIEAAIALGFYPREAIKMIVVPQARSAIFGGMMLGLGRSLGEAMAVSFVLGNVHEAWTLGPGTTLASQILNDFPEAGESLLPALMAAGLMLIAINVILLLVTRRLQQKLKKRSLPYVVARLVARLIARVAVPFVAQYLKWKFEKAASSREATKTVVRSMAWLTLKPTRKRIRRRVARALTWTAPRSDRVRKTFERIGTAWMHVCCAASVAVLCWLLWPLIIRGGLGLLNPDTYLMSTPAPESRGGLLNAIYGSVVITGIALVIASIFAIPAAVYCWEYGRVRVVRKNNRERLKRDPLARILLRVNSLYAGSPSVLKGLFGNLFIVIPFGGFSAWAGAVALSIIALPLILEYTLTGFSKVTKGHHEAALALGLKRWQCVRLFLPVAWKNGGIKSGILQGFARAVGEAAPLALTVGIAQFFVWDPNQTMASLAMVISRFGASPYQDWQNLACTAGLLLVAVVAVTTWYLLKQPVHEQERS